jgi:Beta-propeller repeat
MRLHWIAITVLGVCSCTKDEPSAGKALHANPVVEKKAVDKHALAPLAADTSGATGTVTWATGFGGLGIESARDVAVSASGDVYVAGYFDGETDLGPAGKHQPTGADPTRTSDAYLVKLDSAGKITWGKTFGGKREDAANAVATRGDTVVVAGNFNDDLKIGEFAHSSFGSDDLFVAAFDKAGEPQWLWTAGGIDSDGANAIVATPDGGWVVGGSFSDTVEFGHFRLKSKGGTDAMLIKLAAGGDVEWVKQFGGRYNDSIRHLAVDPLGNIYVQGSFRDVADWGGQPLTAGGGADDDVVLAKYDLNGDQVWSQRFGNAFNDVAGGVCVDAAGNVTMTGSFDKSVSFGKGDEHTSLGESDIFVARFDTDGKLVWANTYGAEREDIGFGIAVDKAGNTVTTGWFQGKVDFGNGPLVSAGNKDVFALKLDPKGALVWAKSWGDHDHDQGRAVAIDDKGGAIIVGLYRFQLALTTPPLESKRAEGDRIPKPDTFVVRLAK